MTKPRLIADSANDNTIDGDRLADDSVSSDKLESGIDGAKLSDGSVPASKFSGGLNSSDVSYSLGTTSAKTTTVQDRLRREVYVDDYIDWDTTDPYDNALVLATTKAIQQAIDDLSDSGGGTLHFGNGKRYCLQGFNRTTGNIDGAGLQLSVKPGVSIEGNGAILDGGSLTTHILVQSDFSDTSATITQDVTRGEFTWTVDSTTGFSIGDDVQIRFLDLPDDTSNAEVKWGYLAKITGVDAINSTLSFNMPAFDDMVVANQRAGSKLVRKLSAVAENLFIKNLNMERNRYTDPGTQNRTSPGIRIWYCRNVHVENCSFYSLTFSAAWSENITFSKCYSRASLGNPGHPFGGTACGAWNCFNVYFKDLILEEFYRNAAFFESNCRGIVMENVLVKDTWRQVTGTQRRDDSANIIAYFIAQQGSVLRLKGVTIIGEGGANSQNTALGRSYQLTTAATGSTIQFEDMESNSITRFGTTTTSFLNYRLFQWKGGYLKDYNNQVGGNAAGMVANYERKETVTYSIEFTGANPGSPYVLPITVPLNCLIISFSVQTFGAGATSISSVRLQNQNPSGSWVKSDGAIGQIDSPTPNEIIKRFFNYSGFSGGNINYLPTNGRRIVVYTSGVPASGTILQIQFEVVKLEGLPNLTISAPSITVP